MILHPENLRITIIRVRAIVGNLKKFLLPDIVKHPLCLLVRSPVHPDHTRADRVHPFIQRDAGAPVQAADGDTFDILFGNSFLRRLGHAVADRIFRRLIPHVRPLLCIERLWRQHVIFLKVLGYQLSVRIHHNCLSSRRSNVCS